jgi:hypothetical protein
MFRDVMRIDYYAKDNYGVTHFYIVDAEIRANVCQLTGRKTLSLSDMLALKNLGFTLNEVLPPRK